MRSAVLVTAALCFFFFYCSGARRALHSFPTRRSSDLRDVDRLRRARAGIAVGKLSGAVGTYSNVDPFVEQHVCAALGLTPVPRSEEHTSELQSRRDLVCRLLLEKKKKKPTTITQPWSP